MGFRTCGVHPGATPADFPGADRVIDTLDLTALAEETDCWIVVATMGHYDDDAVAAALTLAGRRCRARRQRAQVCRGVRDAASPRASPTSSSRGSVLPRACAGRAHRRRSRCTRSPRSWRCGMNGLTAHRPFRDPALLVGFAVDPVCGMTVDTSDATHTAVHEEHDLLLLLLPGVRSGSSPSPDRFVSASAR